MTGSLVWSSLGCSLSRIVGAPTANLHFQTGVHSPRFTRRASGRYVRRPGGKLRLKGDLFVRICDHFSSARPQCQQRDQSAHGPKLTELEKRCVVLWSLLFEISDPKWTKPLTE
ncbi:hypothetical protein BDW62DRAFT_75647 [Aspergillus aurantiobrunneus]